MSDDGPSRDEFRDLLDAYCDGQIDEPGVARLESLLVDNEQNRREFVAYYQLHTDLQFALRASVAARAALQRVDAERLDRPAAEKRRHRAWLLSFDDRRYRRWQIVAAGLLLALCGFLVGHVAWPSSNRPANGVASAKGEGSANIAWLVNAQDCLWEGTKDEMPGRNMRAGKMLRLSRGLAEIEFDRGARVILQGPASLELLSGNQIRLLQGSLTARVPEKARGFTVLSPSGKIVDLGTEFGLSVDEAGATALRVFDGKVEASPLAADDARVTLRQNQAAHIDGRSGAVRTLDRNDPPAQFVRAIVPPPVIVPRSHRVDFSRPVAQTRLDAAGKGVGLTHRLPGTGAALAERDPNLKLDHARGVLELITTRSDLNHQIGLETGEYLGFRLSELGFTGREDFAVSATIPDIPGLETVGQFGLYAGTWSNRNIRGGLISMRRPDSYGLFLVNNVNGRDQDIYRVGLSRTGDDLKLTLRRVAGRYSLVVENLTAQTSSTLSIAHPRHLDAENDLYVGFFGANTQSDVRKTLTIKEVSVTLWTVARDGVATTPGAGETEQSSRNLQ
jgi:hypothetical protein